MTNLEYYKDEIEERFKQLFKCFTDTSSLARALDETYLKHRKQKYESMFTWYFEEHKETIKLKQWEKDLLEIIDYQETRFDFYNDLRNMKKRGYFEGVTDTNMGIKEILENCEVIE